MIALLVALALQAMTQEEMISEGVEIGRVAVVSGFCFASGYSVDDEASSSWSVDYAKRMTAAGWSESVGLQALELGKNQAMAELRPPELGPELTDAQFRTRATDYVSFVKARCHRLHDEHAGLISDLDQGDRNADAKLAIMLRSRDQ